ncbi:MULTISPECIES: hypothetical protein [Ectothiorhodospira]|jgi:hypothetical protein|uniref:Uncharacterized protein n=1 Tax=Ectothiorhodospira marina TaxID=1396821 RepID=A0A1H7QTH3_9GAMM|nr:MULTISPECIES: hypothetical protein [Ectothiorhodospira]SEL50925.1 hypothetical protein SAMN05444515_1196 [Ectothiorhodospira marina]
MITSRSPKKRRIVSRDALLKSVASSTAVETGEASRSIETRLRSGKSRFKSLPLA